MNFLSSDRIRTGLLKREIILNPPASEAQIQLLADRIGEIHPYTISIYKSFNGFRNEDFDAKSEIEIWSIEKILESNNRYFSDDVFPFCSLSLDAMIFVASGKDPRKPVVSYFDNAILSPSLLEFWDSFLSGRFDV